MSTLPYITVSKPLVPKAEGPLDYRTRVDDIETIPNIIRAYVGLIVYVESEHQHYKITSLTQNDKGQYVPSGWSPIGTVWEDEE